MTVASHPSGTPDSRFDPVPLAIGTRSGYSPSHLDRVLLAWAASPPMRALADASGWQWPVCRSTLDLLSRLAELSADWDFRASRERYLIERTPAEANGRQIPDALVTGAARALGLVESPAVPDREFSHLIVLGGQARACVNRMHHAAGLVRDGIRVRKVVALGAHRQLGGGEQEHATAVAHGPLTDEAEVLLAATRAAFRLGTPLISDEPAVPPDPGKPTEFHAASAHYLWPDVEVVIAPSDMPENRRAKTGDQLRYWADLADIGHEDDVLILTTQIYVPYQHLVATRVLGLERRCGVYSCGVDAAGSLLPVRDFGGRDYLQEIRAALRAALALLQQAHGQRNAAPDGIRGTF